MRRVGLGLGADRLTASSPAARELWTRPLEPWSGGVWDDLGDALSELRSTLGLKRGLVSVALLPPLVEVKRLELPPLRRHELERVLARDATRYFLRADRRMVVGTSLLPRDRAARPRVIGAAADAMLVEQVYRQTERVGWTVAKIVPAYAAWARRVAHAAGGARGGGWVVVAGETSVDLLDIAAGNVTSIRRLPPLDEGADAVAAVAAAIRDLRGSGGRPVVALGAGEMPDRLLAVLEAEGISTSAAPELPCAADPHAVAAAFAPHAAGPELIPDAVARGHRHRVRVIARALLAASVVLLAAAAGLEWVGLQRELVRVSQRRHEIRARVAEAMATRTAASELGELVSALDAAEQGFHHWPTTLGHVAATLPRDAHLLGFHADADSLRVEGLADRAAGVMEALQRTPVISSLRADAPIRQETRDSGTPVEHFLLSARLAPPGAPTSSRPGQ